MDNEGELGLWSHSTLKVTWTGTIEIRELQRSIETYDMRYFSQDVLLCTSTVHDQSANICIQRYFRILWIRNTKSFLKKTEFINVMFYVLNWCIYIKVVKLNPWLQQVAVKYQSKNITWNRSMACRLAQPIQVECMSSLCSLWYVQCNIYSVLLSSLDYPVHSWPSTFSVTNVTCIDHSDIFIIVFSRIILRKSSF